MTWTTSTLLQAIQRQASGAGLNIQCNASGNVHASIVVLSDYVGDHEVRLKMPQVGPGGRYLWEQLRPYGIQRNDVWVTNVIKRQVVESDDTKTPIPTNEYQHWRSLLSWELQQLPNVKYILCLGRFALNFITSQWEILRWRGTKLTWQGKQVYIAPNPALVLREPKFDIVFRIDIKKFNLLITGKWNEQRTTTHINPSPVEAVRWIKRMGDEARPISVDIETASDETACIGLANSQSEAMCINFRTLQGHHYSSYEERFIRRELARLFGKPGIKFIAQNGSFDCGWLWWKDRLRIPKLWFDTLLAHHTLYPPLPHNLGFLTSVYTFHPYYKDEKDKWKETGNIDAFWDYNGKDCCYTWEIHEALLHELQAQKMDNFFFNHVMRLQPHLVEIMIHGVKIDIEKKDQVASALRSELEELLAKFHTTVQKATGMADYKPNPNSPKQMKELYFTHLRLVGRGTSTNKDNRARMLAHYKTSEVARQVILLQNDYSKDHKFVSTYAEMKADADGRIRTEYKQYGVESAPGRLSSSQTHWSTGGNLQNQPNRAKPMFIADEGCRFVYFDLSQAEARVVGWDAGIEDWIEQFERARIDGKYDCHRALASQMFKIPYDDVPLDDWDEAGNPTIRYIAKRCRHGLNYRMGPDRLATVTKLPLQEAFKAYEVYHRITPGLKRWWDRQTETVRNEKQLFSFLGRRWLLLERFDDDALESIVAFVPQSTIGDKVSQIIYKSAEHPAWNTERSITILNIHDALIAQVPDDDREASRALSIFKKYAEEPIKIWQRELIIPAEVAWSVKDKDGLHKWSTLQKIKNFESVL